MPNGQVLNADTIAGELRSGDPDLVANALAALDRARRHWELVPVPMPTIDCLEAFGGDVPEEILERFVLVVAHYQLFEGFPERSERLETMVDAVLLHGPGQGVFEVAMYIRIEDDPEYDISEVVRQLYRSPLETASELAVAGQLLEYLLDGHGTHDATVNGLVLLARRGWYPMVVDGLLPQLDDTERERVRRARAEGNE